VALQWHRVKDASYISYATTQKVMTRVLWHQSYLYQWNWIQHFHYVR